ncbi:MAG TPA: GNAT family N-acetyltransferase, partial [Xanthobacteraceae bacterium]|nr:GNAT family N-acetyltransferase [Xanthobacteraceae bacterium]
MTRVTTLTALQNAAAPLDFECAALAPPRAASEIAPHIDISIYGDFAAVEAEWRAFERVAACTVFQAFDWLATWHRHVGLRKGVQPAIAVGRFGDGETAFIFPFGIAPTRSLRRLCWLGEELCDYHAPLIARGFARRVPRERFLAVWQELRARLEREPLYRHDWIELEKLPETLGAEPNPLTYLDVIPNASGAHGTQLGDDWQQFYYAKRSSATRRRDRAKCRHMAEFGDIRFVTAEDADDAKRTLEALIEQKSRSLARRGIPDIFAPEGHREFFFDLACNPQTRRLVHVSRVEVGSAVAAANLGAVFGDCYYHVLASYNEESELAHWGPGALHLRELLAYSIARGLKRFDFTIGDEPYKLEWSDTDLKLYDFIAAASRRGWLASRAAVIRRRVKRFLKQTPWAWRSVSRVRSVFGALRPPAAQSDARRPVGADGSQARGALGCVIGDMDLLRPAALAGIRCAVVTRPGVASLYSRYARSRLYWDDFTHNVDDLVAALISFGSAQSERPVLFYEEDAHLLLISRFRERLAGAFRFVVADAPLVEDLVDKTRFQTLAERHDLPVPATRRFDPAAVEPDELDLRFPVLIKPANRPADWDAAFGDRKALCVDNARALASLWPQLRAVGLKFLAQQLIDGGEDRIESYHCYVDQRGLVAGEFTGRKLRTAPARYGHTTALEITDAADVERLGRSIVERIALTGVAKLDFKRDPQGKLHLLEINPRFNLWHHAGALAGVNIPALVYADLVGIARPPAARAKTGVHWCRAWKDFPAAMAQGV